MITTHSARFGSEIIKYSIIRSANRRRSITIQISPRGEVLVRAPKGTSSRKINVLVQEKAIWITRKVERRRAQGIRPAPEFVNGESFTYLGRNYRLKLQPTDHSSARIVGGFFVVSSPRTRSVTRRRVQIKKSLLNWYKVHALRKLTERINIYMSKVAVTKTPRILIRNQAGRWGSCSPGGDLRFNWRIVMAPLSLVDYVVVHELCHVIRKDHSAVFWTLVRRLLPDYEDRRRRLMAQGGSFSI